MAIQTPEQWLASQQSGVNTSTPSQSRIQTPEEWLKSQPPTKPTLGSKVLNVGKEVVKGIVSPVVTTVARPFQAVAELSGASSESVDKFSNKISGGWIAPVPQNANDVMKDVGRAAQVPLLGVGGSTFASGKTLATIAGREALIGAGIGASGAVEHGGLNTTGKDLLISSAIGAGIGAAVPVVGAGISKVFSKSATKAIEDVALKQTIQDVGQQVEKTGVAQKLPSDKHLAYSKSQGYEPYIPNEQLPTIQTGNIPKSELPTIQTDIVEPKVKPVKGDFTYEPIKEPTPVKDYSTPEIKKPEISTQVDIPDTPEYNANVQERVNKLKEDPLFESSANSDVIKLFDKTKATTSIDELSNAIYGVGDKKLPQGLSEQAAFKLLREDSLLNPQNYTAKQMERLANSYPASMGGKQLQSLQVSKSGMKDTVYDFIDRQTKILKDKALSKGFTTKTISNFIDDIMCSM